MPPDAGVTPDWTGCGYRHLITHGAHPFCMLLSRTRRAACLLASPKRRPACTPGGAGHVGCGRCPSRWPVHTHAHTHAHRHTEECVRAHLHHRVEHAPQPRGRVAQSAVCAQQRGGPRLVQAGAGDQAGHRVFVRLQPLLTWVVPGLWGASRHTHARLRTHLHTVHGFPAHGLVVPP